MIATKEKYQIKGRDFRRVINEAKNIYVEKAKGQNKLIDKNFSLRHVFLKFKTQDKISNPLFVRNDSNIYCEIYAKTKTGMLIVHALEIATIKCGMAFDFKRDDESVKIILRYR